jgi:hypothetical protein
VTQVAAIPDFTGEGLANRKVRTVTVRPDGTIVSGEEGVAGNAILPVERPNVPSVPGADTASPSLLATADPTTTTPLPAALETTPPATTSDAAADAENPATATDAAAIDPAAAALPTTDGTAPVTPVTPPVEPGTTVPVVDTAGNAVPGKTAPVPLLRPSGLVQSTAPTSPVVTPTSPVNAVVETPAATLPPATAATSTVAGDPISQATEVAALADDAPAYVQLASLRTEAEARQAASDLISGYGQLFNGANMEVQRVDLGARGIYYRVRVPATSLQEANTICSNVKSAGGDCFTM